jgi:hypothetical protein
MLPERHQNKLTVVFSGEALQVIRRLEPKLREDPIKLALRILELADMEGRGQIEIVTSDGRRKAVENFWKED